jgi:hypothetical protein
MMLLVRTTLNISDALLEELRDRSRRSGRPMRQVVEQALRRGLSAEKESSSMPVKIEPFRLGLRPAYRGMSMNQIYDQLEAEGAMIRDDHS